MFISVTGEWYSNCYMIQELDSKYNFWHVGSKVFSLKIYKKSKVGQALMYMQYRHMVCGEFHIQYYLVLDQNVNNNS